MSDKKIILQFDGGTAYRTTISYVQELVFGGIL